MARKYPKQLAIAMRFTPPTSVFSTAYPEDDEWVLRNLAGFGPVPGDSTTSPRFPYGDSVSRLFSPPGGHGGEGAGIEGIGLTERIDIAANFGSPNGFLLVMPGFSFFQRPDGSQRNQNVIQGTYNDPKLVDRYIAYDFAYAKRISANSGQGVSLTNDLISVIFLSGLLNEPRMIEYYSVSPTAQGLAFDGEVLMESGLRIPAYTVREYMNQMYTFRNAGELIRAIRVTLYQIVTRMLKDQRVTPIAQGPTSGIMEYYSWKREPYPKEIQFTQEAALAAVRRIESGFFSTKQLDLLIRRVRERAARMVEGLEYEKEWFATPGGSGTTPSGQTIRKANLGTSIEVPPGSLLVWDGMKRKSGDHAFMREIFLRWAPHIAGRGIFVAEAMGLHEDKIQEAWEQITLNNDYAKAERQFKELYPPAPFWTANRFGMKTVPPRPDANVYADVHGAIEDLFVEKYGDWFEILEAGALPTGLNAIDKQKWVRKHVVAPELYADPDQPIDGLRQLISDGWLDEEAPLLSELFYSSYEGRLIGFVQRSRWDTKKQLVVSAKNTPGLVKELRLPLWDLYQVAPKPKPVTTIEDAIRRQVWYIQHIEEDQKSLLYHPDVSPTGAIGLQLLLYCWQRQDQPMAASITPKTVEYMDYSVWPAKRVEALRYYALSAIDSNYRVEVDPNNIEYSIIRLVKPYPPSNRQIDSGQLLLDIDNARFVSAEVAREFMRTLYREDEIDDRLHHASTFKGGYTDYGDLTPNIVKESAATYIEPFDYYRKAFDWRFKDQSDMNRYVRARFERVTGERLSPDEAENVVYTIREQLMNKWADDLSPRMIEEKLDAGGTTVLFGTHGVVRRPGFGPL